jgi:hypothetical protein
MNTAAQQLAEMAQQAIHTTEQAERRATEAEKAAEAAERRAEAAVAALNHACVDAISFERVGYLIPKTVAGTITDTWSAPNPGTFSRESIRVFAFAHDLPSGPQWLRTQGRVPVRLGDGGYFGSLSEEEFFNLQAFVGAPAKGVKK